MPKKAVNAGAGRYAYRALALKEWIKWRRWGVLPFVLLLAAALDYRLSFDALVNHRGASAVWTAMYFRQDVMVADWRWLFAGSGIFWALLQMVPECRDGRLRLMLHLPRRQRWVLSVPLLAGLVLMGLYTACCLGLLTVVHLSLGFPPELSVPILKTVLPWGLAGMVAWVATASAVAEPQALRKLLIVGMGIGYWQLLTDVYGFALYSRHFWIYVGLCLPWLTVLHTSCLRLKGGQ